MKQAFPFTKVVHKMIDVKLQEEYNSCKTN